VPVSAEAMAETSVGAGPNRLRLGTGREALTVALLPDEPTGRVATRSAGCVLLEATLRGRPGGPPVPPLHNPSAPGTRIATADPTVEPLGGAVPSQRREVRALDPGALAAATEALLRSVTGHAALHEAVLEARTVRVANPRAFPPDLVEWLGVTLWRAGLRATFGPVWTPLPPDVHLAVGTGGVVDSEGYSEDYAEGVAGALMAACPLDAGSRGTAAAGVGL